jgi:hypothetical protein
MAPGLAGGLLIAISLFALFAAMALAVRWARRRSRGALMTGALFSIFAPDPEFEKRLRLAEEARQEQHEEEASGAGRDPERG